MSGRGSWNSNGVGGTLSLKGDKPGLYYRLPTTGTNYIGKAINPADANARAVKGAVKAYQAGLNRRLNVNLLLDGILGPVTSRVIVDFQKAKALGADGVIGPVTSKALFMPDLTKSITDLQKQYPGNNVITPTIVCGLVTQESDWDAGSVGFVDETDLGLVQINGRSHPEYSEEQRLNPLVAFPFVFSYLRTSLVNDKIVTVDDAIASYNLGVGGAINWIKAGRPALWDPTGKKPGDPNYNPRDVRGYINKIKTVCAA